MSEINQTIEITSKKIYLEVPFDYKEYAKANDAKWDNDIYRWYVMMTPEQIKDSSHPLDRFRIVFFDCPLRLKDKAKELGAKFLKAERKPLTYRGNYELLELLRKNPTKYEPILTKESNDDFIDDNIDE